MSWRTVRQRRLSVESGDEAVTVTVLGTPWGSWHINGIISGLCLSARDRGVSLGFGVLGKLLKDVSGFLLSVIHCLLTMNTNVPLHLLNFFSSTRPLNFVIQLSIFFCLLPLSKSLLPNKPHFHYV